MFLAVFILQYCTTSASSVLDMKHVHAPCHVTLILPKIPLLRRKITVYNEAQHVLYKVLLLQKHCDLITDSEDLVFSHCYIKLGIFGLDWVGMLG